MFQESSALINIFSNSPEKAREQMTERYSVLPANQAASEAVCFVWLYYAMRRTGAVLPSIELLLPLLEAAMDGGKPENMDPEFSEYPVAHLVGDGHLPDWRFLFTWHGGADCPAPEVIVARINAQLSRAEALLHFGKESMAGSLAEESGRELRPWKDRICDDEDFRELLFDSSLNIVDYEGCLIVDDPYFELPLLDLAEALFRIACIDAVDPIDETAFNNLEYLFTCFTDFSSAFTKSSKRWQKDLQAMSEDQKNVCRARFKFWYAVVDFIQKGTDYDELWQDGVKELDAVQNERLRAMTWAEIGLRAARSGWLDRTKQAAEKVLVDDVPVNVSGALCCFFAGDLDQACTGAHAGYAGFTYDNIDLQEFRNTVELLARIDMHARIEGLISDAPNKDALVLRTSACQVLSRIGEYDAALHLFQCQ